MKKIFIFLFTVAVSVTAFSQSSAILDAVLYHKNQELDKAKLEIDKAVVHEKTKADPQAWYQKGVIYTDLSRTEKPEFASLAPNALMDAYDAFKKAKELDPAQGQYYKLAETKLKELYPDFINKGADEYNTEKVKEAYTKFKIAQELNPNDTSGYIYGCYAAETLGDDENLKKYVDKLVSLNYKSQEFYRTRIYLEQDPAKKLTILKEAETAYPGSELLIEIAGDVYSEQGKYQEALKEYQKLVTLMPENVAALTKVAIQYEKLQQTDKALETYDRILKLDNFHFIANYNKAIIYFEKGKAENEKVHKLSVDEYHKQGKAMEEEVNKLFATAYSHASAALKLTNDDDDQKNINLMISEINKIIKK
ncbi:MAG: tetratricopeptide repeat protein [Cytophagaceae bacterium]|nr:tetratricopeptide repeat protein [Cytophagaceae bacterium]